MTTPATFDSCTTIMLPPPPKQGTTTNPKRPPLHKLYKWAIYSLCYRMSAKESLFINSLKTLDTIGNCQRPVFSLGVSQDMHEITDL